MTTCNKCGGVRGVATVVFKDLGKRQHALCMYCIRKAPLSDKGLLKGWLGGYNIRNITFESYNKGLRNELKLPVRKTN